MVTQEGRGASCHFIKIRGVELFFYDLAKPSPCGSYNQKGRCFLVVSAPDLSAFFAGGLTFCSLKLQGGNSFFFKSLFFQTSLLQSFLMKAMAFYSGGAVSAFFYRLGYDASLVLGVEPISHRLAPYGLVLSRCVFRVFRIYGFIVPHVSRATTGRARSKIRIG